jgi:hypothetical protein
LALAGGVICSALEIIVGLGLELSCSRLIVEEEEFTFEN